MTAPETNQNGSVLFTVSRVLIMDRQIQNFFHARVLSSGLTVKVCSPHLN